MLNSGIYKITNTKTFNFYIGSAKDFKKRWTRHKKDLKYNKHHSIRLQRSYNKHGVDNFTYEIIARCPIDYLIKLEQWFLDNLKPQYNILKIASSRLGAKLSEEHKRKLSIFHKGNKWSLGNKPSLETRLKYAELAKNRVWTKTSRRKLSVSKMGNKSRSGMPHLEETKKKMSLNNGMLRAIIQLDLEGNFIKEWRCIMDVERELNILGSSITNCCKTYEGINVKRKRQTAGKFKWKYKENYERENRQCEQPITL